MTPGCSRCFTFSPASFYAKTHSPYAKQCNSMFVSQMLWLTRSRPACLIVTLYLHLFSIQFSFAIFSSHVMCQRHGMQSSLDQTSPICLQYRVKRSVFVYVCKRTCAHVFINVYLCVNAYSSFCFSRPFSASFSLSLQRHAQTVHFHTPASTEQNFCTT